MFKNLVFVSLVSILLSGCPMGVPRAPRAPRVSLGPTIDLGPKISGPSGSKAQQQMALQVSQLMLSYKVSPGGFWLWQKDFESGEWTKWDVYSDGTKEMETEFAYLGSFTEGRKWWRLAYSSESEDTYAVFEALIDHFDYSFRRLRSKINDGEKQEVPVPEETFLPVQPKKLTPESIQAATVGQESVNVPAGSFNASLVRFTTDDDGELNIWVNHDVPGGVVKYSLSHDGEEMVFDLKEYGTDAVTLLDSF